MHVRPPQYRLALQGQGGDRVGDGVDQKLAPHQRRELATEQDTERRPSKQAGKAPAGFIVGDGNVLLAALSHPYTIGSEPLAVEIDDRRQHGGAVRQRGDALDMADAVLQHRDARRGRAQPRQPRRGCRGLMRLGAQHDPVGRLRDLSGIGKRSERQFGRARRRLKRQSLDRLARARDHMMAAGGDKAASHGSADAAEADNGDALTRFGVRRWRRVCGGGGHVRI